MPKEVSVAHVAGTVDLNDEIYELAEASVVIKMSPKWLEQSDVPRARLGRRVVFLKSELLAYVAARLTTSVTERAK